MGHIIKTIIYSRYLWNNFWRSSVNAGQSNKKCFSSLIFSALRTWKYHSVVDCVTHNGKLGICLVILNASDFLNTSGMVMLRKCGQLQLSHMYRWAFGVNTCAIPVISQKSNLNSERHWVLYMETSTLNIYSK